MSQDKQEGLGLVPDPQTGKRKTWVLVADEAIAHLYELPEDGGDLVPVEQITDPAAHTNTSEGSRDSAGRRGGDDLSMGGNVTTSAGDQMEGRESARFAAQVATLLAERLRQKRYEALHVAAAPKFLGHLRKALAKPVTAVVARELDKDLIHETAAQLTARLFPQRVPASGGRA
jgi:protein required for attachment to host cells